MDGLEKPTTTIAFCEWKVVFKTASIKLYNEC